MKPEKAANTAVKTTCKRCWEMFRFGRYRSSSATGDTPWNDSIVGGILKGNECVGLVILVMVESS